MLSYQHTYHAGSFADVQKHAVLAKLIRLLAQKTQPFAFLDTHAGRGLYDLSSTEAQKTGEFNHGILPFWEGRAVQSPLSDYLDIVSGCNADGRLKTYPGSAMIAHRLMRPADRLLLIERHPAEHAALQKNFKAAGNVDVKQADGFQSLVDSVPFSGRRGLVLVDPSYEIKSEYAHLPRQLARAFKKWPQGQFMVWYPLLGSNAHEDMLAHLRGTDVVHVLAGEIRLDAPPKESFGMYGSGVLIINPPHGFETALNELMRYIAAGLPAKALAQTFWLDNRHLNAGSGRLA